MNQATRLLLAAVNLILATDRQPYRVGGAITLTRRGGYTFIALEEMTPDEAAKSAVYCPPPIVHMAQERQ